MKITNEFTVHTPIERAWAVLTDLEGIAPCLPGAHLTGVDGDTYSGKVKVKVGPVVSDFAGTARFIEKDDEARRAVIDAKGRDSRSAGNAAAVVTAQLRADGDRTLVNVDTDLKISGKLAQFGSGMIKEVSGKLLGQFVANLEAKLAAEPAAPAPATTESGEADLTRGSEVGLTAENGREPAVVAAGSGEAATSAGAAGWGGGDASAGAAGWGGGDASAGAAGSGGGDASAGAAGTGGVGSDGDGPLGAGTVTGGDPGAADTPSDTPATAFDVAASASSVGGTALRVVPEQKATTSTREDAETPEVAETSRGARTSAGADAVEDGVASGESVRVPEKSADEPEALDLLALAGGSVYKRLIPLGIGVAAVAAAIVWFVARR